MGQLQSSLSLSLDSILTTAQSQNSGRPSAQLREVVLKATRRKAYPPSPPSLQDPEECVRGLKMESVVGPDHGPGDLDSQIQRLKHPGVQGSPQFLKSTHAKIVRKCSLWLFLPPSRAQATPSYKLHTTPNYKTQNPHGSFPR